MHGLKIDLMTFDVGEPCGCPADFSRLITDRVLQSWDGGANIAVFPEFAWMGLERFIHDDDKIGGVADLFWNSLWPGMLASLSRPGHAAVLGTVPFKDGACLRNRAPIVDGGEARHQDKIHLTPWEDAFTGKGPLRIWNFKGIRIAVVICMDIEIPEISAALRGREVDLILVPSATESILGVERVGRCADARSVELACHVALCHLVGRTESVLIDENIGRLAVYSPSQSPFAAVPRSQVSPLHDAGFHRLSVDLDIATLRQFRADATETDPSKSRPAAIVIEDTDQSH